MPRHDRTKQDRLRERQRAARAGRQPAGWALLRQVQARPRRPTPGSPASTVEVAGRLDTASSTTTPPAPSTLPTAADAAGVAPATLADLLTATKQAIADGLADSTLPASVAARAVKDLLLVEQAVGVYVELRTVQNQFEESTSRLFGALAQSIPPDAPNRDALLDWLWSTIAACWLETDCPRPTLEPAPDEGPNPGPAARA